MVIKLYRTRSEKNSISKSLQSELSLEGTLRDETSIKNPVLRVVGDTSIVSYNYVYIESFSRYYFVNDIRSVRTGLWELYLTVDVLMSFKTEILGCVGIIDHTTTVLTDEYLPSDIWQALVKDKTDIINFNGSSLLSSGEYILITAGG